jgi:hypothetical protein
MATCHREMLRFFLLIESVRRTESHCTIQGLQLKCRNCNVWSLIDSQAQVTLDQEETDSVASTADARQTQFKILRRALRAIHVATVLGRNSALKRESVVPVTAS